MDTIGSAAEKNKTIEKLSMAICVKLHEYVVNHGNM
jgi:hypothetical protein